MVNRGIERREIFNNAKRFELGRVAGRVGTGAMMTIRRFKKRLPADTKLANRLNPDPKTVVR